MSESNVQTTAHHKMFFFVFFKLIPQSENESSEFQVGASLLLPDQEEWKWLLLWGLVKTSFIIILITHAHPVEMRWNLVTSLKTNFSMCHTIAFIEESEWFCNLSSVPNPPHRCTTPGSCPVGCTGYSELHRCFYSLCKVVSGFPENKCREEASLNH